MNYNNLKILLENYNENFAGKTVEMTSNYKKIPCFRIKMETNNLPHLLGLHYCVKGKSATDICTMINSGLLRYEQVKATDEFKVYNIKSRIESYVYLEEFLKNAEGRVFYPTENLKPNPMKLVIVFSERKSTGEVVLGCKRDVQEEAFRLATLHYSRKRKYTEMKSSKILSVKWDDI